MTTNTLLNFCARKVQKGMTVDNHMYCTFIIQFTKINHIVTITVKTKKKESLLVMNRHIDELKAAKSSRDRDNQINFKCI